MTYFNPRLLLIPLLMLAACVHETASGKEYDVRSFGAIGDGKTLDSPAINRAIDTAASAGGGIVVLAAGRYLSGSIRLKNDIHLKIDKGAVIVAEKWNSKSYDPTEPFTPPAYQDGGHCYFQNSLIWGENLKNVTISGGGMIDGSGLTSWEGDLNKKVGFGSGSEGFSPAQPQNPGEPTYAANKAISLKLCKNVVIRDLTILKGGWFAILTTGCDKVLMENLTIDTNRDGIDIDCCNNVVVRNCRVNSPYDDAICPKSTYVLGYTRLTENLLIENCQVSGFMVGTLLDGSLKPDPKDHRNGRIKFGTEATGGFRNCVVRDCVFLSSMGFTLQQVDGGILENIEVSNLRMKDVKNYALYIVTGERNRTPDRTAVSRMKNVRISNVVAEGVDKMSGIQIFGTLQQPIEGLKLENINIISKGGGTAKDAARVPKDLGKQYPDPSGKGNMPAYGLFARHVKGLHLTNLSFTFESPDCRPVAKFENIDGLTLDRFQGQTGESLPVAIFAPDVRSVIAKDSPAVIISSP